jgi:predicted acetyltransferase
MSAAGVLAPSTAAALTVRAVDLDDDAELDTWMSTTNLVFTSAVPHTAERRDARRPVYRRQRLTAAFDGPTLAATYRSWDWQVSLPGGGTITADAVSSVTVRPTHRRRGALTALITADLAGAVTRGVPAAVLVASEAGIYGRFGFGPATEGSTWTLDVGTARIGPQVPREGTVELCRTQELLPFAPEIFDASRAPGATDRDVTWWELQTGTTTTPGDPPPRPQHHGVLYRDPLGHPRGYLVYSTKDDWRDRVCHTVATLHDLQAATDAAYAALWRFLTELDLVATVVAEDRAVDEPLPWLLTDPRAARRTSTCDMLWARLLDPAVALSARRYESPGRSVLDVTDPLGHATGRLELDVDGSGRGTATPTRSAPEVTVPVDVLSAAWLGGGDLRAAAIAGRLTEHAPGAVDRLARLLRTTRAPWTGTWF